MSPHRRFFFSARSTAPVAVGAAGPERLAASSPDGPALPATRYPLLATALASSAAFTLVEVMMASVILVVGFMGMIGAITIGSEMLATAQRQTLAAQILTHELEKLRLTSWSSMPSAGTSTLTVDSQFDNARAACGLTTSSISLSETVTDIDTDSDGTTDFKEVTLTFTWTKSGSTAAAATPTGSWLEKIAFYRESPIGRTYTRKASGYYTKYGLNLAAQR